MNLKRTVAASAVALVSMGGAGIAIAQTNSDGPRQPTVLEDIIDPSGTAPQSGSVSETDDTVAPDPETGPTTSLPNGLDPNPTDDETDSSEEQDELDDDDDLFDDDFDDVDDELSDDDDQGEDDDDRYEDDDETEIDDDDSVDGSSTTVAPSDGDDDDDDDDDRYEDDSFDDDSQEFDDLTDGSRR